MADELNDGVATPEIAMSKAEFTEVIQRKIGEALAPKLRKLEEMQAQVETLSAQAARAEELEAQLAAIEYKIDSKGRMLVESKDTMKARNLPSPDRADWLAYVFASAGKKPAVGSVRSRPRQESGVML